MNMIEAAELIVLSSLQREESRGPFMRRDFPETDNENWLTANLLHKAGNGYRFEKRPYSMSMFQPDFARRDNLEVPW
jgi:succinate dehydrogenase/fumarate reductase flavoprotein subunit